MTAEIFDEIHRQNTWRGQETRSGIGAGDTARRVLAPAVAGLVAELGVSSVLDLGCGEGYWMPDLPGYIGMDISPVVIAAAQRRHERVYRVDDGSPLPSCELVISRCVIQHMLLPDAVGMLSRIRASGATWLLCTTYEYGANALVRHEDIAAGGGFWPRMQDPPFSLGDPVRHLEDGHTDDADARSRLATLALWRLA